MAGSTVDRLLGGGLARRLLSLERQRRHWLARAPSGPLRDFYDTPFPSPASPATAVRFVSLDFETTGFDPARDEILSIGFVPVRDGALLVGQSVHRLVRPSGAVPPSSAVVHGILDDRARSGAPLAEAVPPLLAALAGNVLVAHHAAIERGFLDRVCRRLYGHPFVAPIVDTLEIERRTLARRGRPIAPGSLRLAALRESYGLPRYRAHDALIDALATAELLLAQIAHRSGEGREPRLAELLLGG